MPDVDAEFTALPLSALADAALGRARDLGAQHADIRVERLVGQSIGLRDGAVTGVSDSVTLGLAVRVIVDGVWGFASHVELTPERAAAVAEQAVAVARTLAPVAVERVERAGEPVHSGRRPGCRPTTSIRSRCATRDKVELLTEWSQQLLASRRRRPRQRRRAPGQGEQVLRRPGRHLDDPAAGAASHPTSPPPPSTGPPAGSRRCGAGPARRPRLGVPDRHGLGLGRRPGAAARAAAPRR